MDSVDYDAFVRTGLVGSADFFLDGAAVAANEEGMPRDETISVTCNDEAFKGSTCIGETLVPPALGFRLFKSTCSFV